MLKRVNAYIGREVARSAFFAFFEARFSSSVLAGFRFCSFF
jgi:hypothetical protein